MRLFNMGTKRKQGQSNPREAMYLKQSLSAVAPVGVTLLASGVSEFWCDTLILIFWHLCSFAIIIE